MNVISTRYSSLVGILKPAKRKILCYILALRVFPYNLQRRTTRYYY